MAEPLARRYRLTMIDWPGHGHSGADAGPPDVVNYGKLLAGLIAQQGLRNVILIGNSIGCRVGQITDTGPPVLAR